MSQEVVQVGVRVRRLIPREIHSGKDIKWSVEENRIWSEDDARQKVYRFDHVWDASAINSDVYELLCRHIISSAFLGFNGTIFAYGQTSSGKTHTMMGDEDEPGVIPAAIDGIFDLIEATPKREFLLRVSYFEIYNENVVDLLAGKEGRKKSLQLKEDPQGNVLVDGGIERTVTSPEEVIQCLFYGEQNRHIGATNMNERSSRSHTIFRLIIESSEMESEENGTADGAITVSHLNLVDLAGSERVSQAGTGGKSLREGGNINKSLLVLSQVISKLSEGSREFVPFRDSKLTRILKTSLGGNARTAIICTVTPVEKEQTKSTLEFASRAKNIVQHAKVNEVLDDQALLRRLKNEIAALQHQLEEERNADRVVELEQQFKSVLSEKDRQMQEKEKQMEKEREKLRLDMEVKERQLQDLTDRLLSGDGHNSTSQLQSSHTSNKTKHVRRETWAPASNRRTTRRVSFFPKFLANNKENIDLEGNLSFSEDFDNSPVFDTSEHETFITDRSRRKTVRFGLTSCNNYSEEESESPVFTPPSVLRKEVKRLSRLLENTQREYSELSEFTQLESKLMQDSPKRNMKDLQEELRNANKSKTDLENLYLSSNKELHEAKLRIKDLEDNIQSIKDDNSSKESLKMELSKIMSSYKSSEEEREKLMRSLKEVQERLQFLEREKEDFEFRFQLSEDKFKKKEQELIQSLNEARGEVKNADTSPNNSSIRSESTPFGDVTLNAIEELTKRLEQLQNYVNDLEDEVRLNKEANLAKDRMIDELNDKNTSGEENELFNEMSAAKDYQISLLQNELNEARKAIEDQLGKNNEALKNSTIQNISSDNVSREEVAQLKSELAESKEKISELEDNAMVILNDYETLEKEKVELEKDNLALKDEIMTLRTHDESTNELLSTIASLEAESTKKEDELGEMKLTIQKLTAELRQGQEKINKEKEALLQKRESSMDENACMQSKIDGYLSDLNEKDKSIASLSSECKLLNSRMEELHMTISDISGLKEELEREISVLKSALSEKASFENQNDNICEDFSNLKIKFAGKEEELCELKSALDNLTVEHEAIKSEKDSLIKQCDEKDIQLKESLQNLSFLREKSSRGSHLESQLECCMSEMSRKDETIGSLSSECKSLSSRIEELNLQIDELRTFKLELETKVSALESDLNEKTSSESDHEKASKELSALKDRFAQKDQELIEMQETLNNLGHELQSLKDDKNALLKLNEKKETEHQESLQKIQSLMDKVSQASDIQSDHQNCLLEINEKDAKISSLTLDCKNLHSEIERLHLQISELNDYKSKLENRISTLEADFDSKKSSEFEYKKQSEDLSRDLSNLKVHSTKTDEELLDLKGSFEKLTYELLSTKDDKNTLLNQLNEKETQLQECINRLKSLLEKSPEASGIESKLQNCLIEVNEKNEKISSLTSESKSMKAQIDELKKEIEGFNGCKSKLERKITTLESDLDKKTSSESEFKKLSEDLSVDLSSLKINFNKKDEELHKMKEMMEKLASKLKTVTNEKNDLQHELYDKESQLQETLEKMKSRIENSSKDIQSNLQNCLIEIDEKNNKIRSLTSECKSLSTQIEGLNLQINDLSGFKSKLELKVSTLQSSEVEYKKSCKELCGELSALKEQVAKKDSELLEKNSTLNKLTSQLQSAQGDTKNLQKLCLEKDDLLKENLEKLNAKEEDSRSELMKKEFEGQSEIIKSLRAQVSFVQDLESENNKLLVEIEDCKEQNRRLQKQITKAMMESSDRSELKELKEALKSSNLKSAAMEVQLVYKDKEIDKLQKDLSFMISKSNAYKDELRKVQNENLDTTVYSSMSKTKKNLESDLRKPEKGPLESNSKSTQESQDKSLAITTGDLASELYLKVKEHDIQRLKKEIDDRIAHEKTIMTAYHKWKKIAKEHEEELNELKKRLLTQT